MADSLLLADGTSRLLLADGTSHLLLAVSTVGVAADAVHALGHVPDAATPVFADTVHATGHVPSALAPLVPAADAVHALGHVPSASAPVFVAAVVVHGLGHVVTPSSTTAGDPLTVPVPSFVATTLVDPATVVASFTPMSFSFQDRLNEVGAFKFTLPYGDPANTLLEMGMIVSVVLAGRRVWSGFVERRVRTRLAVSAEAGMVTHYEGRGIGAVWERALVYPPRGADTYPFDDTRPFSWGTVNGSEAAFIDGTPIGTTAGLYAVDPDAYPDSTATTMWRPDGTLSWAKPEVAGFKDTITSTASVSNARLFVTARHVCSVLVDDVLLGTFSWPDIGTYDVPLTAGDHSIAGYVKHHPLGVVDASPTTHLVTAGETLQTIADTFYGDSSQWQVIYNVNKTAIDADATAAGLYDSHHLGAWIFAGQTLTIPGMAASSGENPAWYGWSLYELLADNTLGALLGHSQHGAPADEGTSFHNTIVWDTNDPGMTPAYGLRLLLGEQGLRAANPTFAIALGGVPVPVILIFTDGYDSEGVAWPYVADLEARVGDSYLSVLLDWSATYFDWWMNPSTSWPLQINAVQTGARGLVSGVEFSNPLLGGDAAVANLIAFVTDEQDDTASVLLSRWDGGYHEKTDGAAVTAHGRREDSLPLGSLRSLPEVDRVQAGQLDVFAHPRTAIEFKYVPRTAAQMWGVGFGTGDTVTILDSTGDITDRVVGATLTLNDDGLFDVSLEVGDVILDAHETEWMTIRKMVQ